MLHPYSTQINKSLNMRALEVAPTDKNYSQTVSLYYRISLVVRVHNMGSQRFFKMVFEELGIENDGTIERWFCKVRRRNVIKHPKTRCGGNTDS